MESAHFKEILLTSKAILCTNPFIYNFDHQMMNLRSRLYCNCLLKFSKHLILNFIPSFQMKKIIITHRSSPFFFGFVLFNVEPKWYVEILACLQKCNWIVSLLSKRRRYWSIAYQFHFPKLQLVSDLFDGHRRVSPPPLFIDTMLRPARLSQMFYGFVV